MTRDSLTIGNVTAIHYIINDLVVNDPGISPHEVVAACNDGTILELIVSRAESYGVDASLIPALYGEGEGRRILLDNLASWGNVVDVERKIGVQSGGPFGWLALSQGFLDQFYRMYARDLPVTW